MNIPNLPNEKIATDSGEMHPKWRLFFTQLITEIQNNLSNEGYALPQQPTSNIALLNTAKSNGRLIYDSTTQQVKANISGTYRVVSTT